jgi:UDP-N-acetylmuramate--alanine ligase
MNLEQIHKVYFVGIGGIGMSALARYFNSLGKKVAGYDRSETPLTKELTGEGILIHYTDDISCIPLTFRDAMDTLVVYTPAVPVDHTELHFFHEKGFPVKKRAEVLGTISRSKNVLAIAGTHGKTTTSTMVAHLLKSSALDCNAFLGGISLNYQSNLLLSEKSSYVVVEADEYDRSFLQLNPKAAIITSMDADHLDIYGSYAEYQKAFVQFVSQIHPEGFLVVKKGLNIENKVSGLKVYTYSLDDRDADFYAQDISIKDGFYHYNLVTPKGEIKDITLGFPGLLNVENSIAAMAMAFLLNAGETAIRSAMASFRGVKRRFEYHIKNENLIFIDDYGHHPEELRFTIESVKEMFPGKKVTGIFQPHLYSRTNDFADDFAKSLSLLDELILLEIYPAREKPIPGVTSEMILQKVTTEKKHLCNKNNLVEFLSTLPLPQVILTMGAGDIDSLVEPVKEILMKKLQNIHVHHS